MVEWKKLGEIGEVCMCKRIMKEQTSDSGDIPFFKIGTFGSTADSFISRELFEEYKSKYSYPKKGEILISAAGTIGRSVIFDGNDAYFQDSNIVWISNDENVVTNRYLYYCYQIIDWKIDGGTIKRLYNYNLKNAFIPTPSLSEQQRIVGILDTFTASIDNLKEQITQRRKQYEYYRDQLLDLEGKEDKDIHLWGEFCEMIKGNGVQKVDFVDEGFGCIHYGQIYTHYGPFTYTTNKFVPKEVFDKARKASKGDIIMTDTSENVEDICKSVAWLGEGDIAVSNHALIIKHKQNPKFLSFSTQTNDFFIQKRKVVVGVKVSGIKPEHLAQIKIYLPSLEEQSRIVGILDTFETSIQNLEAQLKEREKQYEYYRNKLLTFE